MNNYGTESNSCCACCGNSLKVIWTLYSCKLASPHALHRTSCSLWWRLVLIFIVCHCRAGWEGNRKLITTKYLWRYGMLIGMNSRQDRIQPPIKEWPYITMVVLEMLIHFSNDGKPRFKTFFKNHFRNRQILNSEVRLFFWSHFVTGRVI